LIKFTQRGDFSKTQKFLSKLKDKDLHLILGKYGAEGVSLLQSVTPKESGLTSGSWSYKVVRTNRRISIQWLNTNENGGIPIVILLQYGHGTRGGTFVEGRDFINPVMRPLFDKISEDIWKEVTSL
jgi:hypothetical protein